MAVKKAKTVKKKPEGELEITLIRSLIGCSPAQRAAARGLGLRKLHGRVIRKDRPETWGMIKKIFHLVRVEAREKP